MSAPLSELVTADELLNMGGVGRCELIYGELVRMDFAGFAHGIVAGRIGMLLGDFVEFHDLGMVLAAGTGFKIESNPDLVRAPDASFIHKSRVPAKLTWGFFLGAPELAVEVVSPDDATREVSEKANMWLAHGTTSVWVVDPSSMTIAVHRTGKKPIRLGIRDVLRDEPALPGFSVPISRIFKRP